MSNRRGKVAEFNVSTAYHSDIIAKFIFYLSSSSDHQSFFTILYKTKAKLSKSLDLPFRFAPLARLFSPFSRFKCIYLAQCGSRGKVAEAPSSVACHDPP